jgi:hypothetical protein
LRKGAAALAFLAALAGCSQDHPRSTPVAQSAPAPEPTAPPKLVVAISIDQFSADLFAQYRQHFTGGFARLTQGAVFPSAFQSHAATETCPGHSTLLTGAHPSRTGIIANNWFDLDAKRADKRVYCAEDACAHLGRADESRQSGDAQCRGFGQGPRRGDDGRPHHR